MSVFTNKHLVIAMLVAPVLAILSYFALGALVGESPKPAQEGQSYRLAEKPNCRWESGLCELKNADFELQLGVRTLAEDRVSLMLKSVFPLEGVMVALIEQESEDQVPVAMQPLSDDGLVWVLDLARPDPERDRLRLVASALGSLYYGDVSTKFTLSELPGKDS
jgi:hypothetical protein